MPAAGICLKAVCGAVPRATKLMWVPLSTCGHAGAIFTCTCKHTLQYVCRVIHSSMHVLGGCIAGLQCREIVRCA
jgi:hypothetical protein